MSCHQTSKSAVFTIMAVCIGSALAIGEASSHPVQTVIATATDGSGDVTQRAAKKISLAIGEEIGDFTVTHIEEAEAPTGYNGTEYTVRSGGGKTYKCKIMESSKVGKIFTLGMGSGADAMCSEFSGGSGKRVASVSEPKRATGGGKAGDAAGGMEGAAGTITITDRAAKKISLAIGEEVGSFTVSHQEEAEAPTGYNGMEYTVHTGGGKTYKCKIMESSKVGKIFTLGMGSGADAMCTDFTKGSAGKGKTNAPACNALLRAAGKC
mgnify:CR=1 FL=1